MNISNISADYFYDEEYDYNCPFVGTRDQSFGINSIFFDKDEEFWSGSILETSGNNNNFIFDRTFNLPKCISSDQVIDGSIYSLNKNIPSLAQPQPDENYHLCFDKKENKLFDSNDNIIDVRKLLIKRHGSKLFTDSGKGSATTSDSNFHPIRFCEKNVIREGNRKLCNKTNSFLQIRNKKNQKSKSEIWRYLKNLFSNKKMKWSELTYCDTKCCPRSYSTPDLTDNEYFQSEKCSNRFSTTIVELYNSVELDCSNDIKENKANETLDFACQFPDRRKIKKLKKNRKQINEYHGVGKILVPINIRTSFNDFCINDGITDNLGFLTKPVCPRRSKSYARSRNREDSQLDKEVRRPARPRSETRTRERTNEEIEEKAVKHMTLEIEKLPTYHDGYDYFNLTPIQENRSFSFADLRPIPRKLGLDGGSGVNGGSSSEFVAVFEMGPTSTNKGNTGTHAQKLPSSNADCDGGASQRLAGMVSNALEAIRLLSSSIGGKKEELNTLCDNFARCKDSRRSSTVRLVAAVDSVLSLISDGVAAGTIGRLGVNRRKAAPTDRSRQQQQQLVHQRLWLLVEESCRSSSGVGFIIKDPRQRSSLASLVKTTKQQSSASIDGAYNAATASQLRLQLFLAASIRAGLLSSWLRDIVSNESLLSRFFSPAAFLRQARTHLSNAMSALIIELRRLQQPATYTPVATQNANLTGNRSRIRRPITPIVSQQYRTSSRLSRQTNTSTSPSSSNSNSTKSRIPRPVPVK